MRLLEMYNFLKTEYQNIYKGKNDRSVTRRDHQVPREGNLNPEWVGFLKIILEMNLRMHERHKCIQKNRDTFKRQHAPTQERCFGDSQDS